jgi:hypothetical protein
MTRSERLLALIQVLCRRRALMKEWRRASGLPDLD